MPKRSKHPRLRVHIKRGKAGQVWTSYWFDNRGTVQPDVPLGTDYDAALLRWAELRQGALRITGTVEEALRRYERDVLPHLKAETAKGYTKSLRRIRSRHRSRIDGAVGQSATCSETARTAPSRRSSALVHRYRHCAVRPEWIVKRRELSQ